MSLYVKYIDAPEVALQSASSRVDPTESQLFSDPSHLSHTASPDTPWASLEPGSWALDGTRRLFPDNPSDIGWWSEQRSGEDGRFENPPVLRLWLPPNNPVSAPGVTFRFWPSLDHWCSEVRVTWYYYGYNDDGTEFQETMVAQTTAYPDSAEWFLEQEVKGFNRVDVELLSTNIPGHFAKLQYLQVGEVIFFLQDELVRVNLLTETDPSACELPADELTVEIYDKKGRKLRPQKNQPVQLYQNGEILASHYIVECTRENRDRYLFRCQSAIGRLDKQFLGGIYTDYPVFDPATGKGLLPEILNGFRWDLKIAANTLPKITGYLPVCTRREALQQLAFAIGAVITTRNDGFIVISPPEESVTATFTEGNIFTGAKLTEEPQIAAIQVNAHQYVQSAEEETVLDGAEVLGGSRDVIFTFSEPHHTYYIDPEIGSPQGTYFDGFANYASFSSLRNPWLVTLIASKYIHNTNIHSRTYEDGATAEKSNIVKVENATLINSGNVSAALDRLEAFHKLKNVLTQQVVVDGQKVGQMVESINPWGTVTVGYITRMESEFTANGHTANVTIRGTEEEVATE